MSEQSLKRTCLHQEHVKRNAKMVPFGGWEMPVQYSSIVEEHKAVRTKAGLFDVSHMGEFEISGSNAAVFTQYLTANDVSRLGIGRGQYSLFLNEHGGVIDDIIVYRIGQETYLIVVNASNIDKDWDHVSQLAKSFDPVTIQNRSSDYGLIALQGPSAESVMTPHFDRDLNEIAFFRIRKGNLAGKEVWVARTGYTGEGKNGFEIFSKSDDAPLLWNALLESNNVVPAGLGARDTLRIEASLPLYGHELNDTTTPLEAGLGIFIAESDKYIGSSAIAKQRKEGLSKTLVMLEMVDRGIPRQGYIIQNTKGEPIGTVTSGTVAPWIEKNIAMGFVYPEQSSIGSEVLIEIRNRQLKAKIVSKPFFKR